jgi:hypothetical protein
MKRDHDDNEPNQSSDERDPEHARTSRPASGEPNYDQPLPPPRGASQTEANQQDADDTSHSYQPSAFEYEDPDSSADFTSQASTPKRRTRKRRVIAGATLLLITICGVAAFYYTFRPSRSVKVNIGTKQRARTQDAAANPDKAPDDVTAEAIAEVRRAISSPPAGTAPATVTPRESLTLAPPMSATVLPPDSASTEPAEADRSGASAAEVSRRNREQSIRFADDDQQPATRKVGFGPAPTDATRGQADKAPAGTAILTGTRPSQAPSPITKPAAAPVVLPSFGSVLPVRTLGKIYTLRSGSSIRLELTRYVSGEGWSLPKGTVLIGQVRGSERDRAFIAVAGFIEPSRERFVKLTGEVLGDDGGAGVRGKFHKLSSGWSRAFARIGSSAVNVAGAIAGSRISGQPVIITDLGSRTVSPLGNEVDSLLLSQARGFVEVAAGTPGFVMVTTLPGDVKGVDAEPDHFASAIPEIATTEPAALTEEDLALLLTSGDAARIREALPRMSPEMRRIAEVVLADSSRITPEKD